MLHGRKIIKQLKEKKSKFFLQMIKNKSQMSFKNKCLILFLQRSYPVLIELLNKLPIKNNLQSLNVCNYYESFKSTIEKFLKFWWFNILLLYGSWILWGGVINLPWYLWTLILIIFLFYNDRVWFVRRFKNWAPHKYLRFKLLSLKFTIFSNNKVLISNLIN